MQEREPQTPSGDLQVDELAVDTETLQDLAEPESAAVKGGLKHTVLCEVTENPDVCMPTAFCPLLNRPRS